MANSSTNRKSWKTVRGALSLAGLALVVSATPALAYVDPGSASVIVTTVLGLIAGIGYTFRKYFYRMKRLLTGRGRDEERSKDSNAAG